MTGARRKILFVDDDPLMHRLYRPHIERAGYEMLCASDGSEVAEIACHEMPCIVVLDMLLTGKDGVVTLQELKAQEAAKEIPVIAISAEPQYHKFRRELMGLGAELFLSKPFGPARLVSEILRLDHAAGSSTPLEGEPRRQRWTR